MAKEILKKETRAMRQLPAAMVVCLAFSLAMFVWTSTAMARIAIYSSWSARYPSSTSDDKIIAVDGQPCRLCHETSQGGDGWNGYGWAVRQSGVNFAGVEGLNSDGDAGGYTNLQEINANAQPGWTTGSNIIYYKSGATGTASAPGVTPLDAAPTTTTTVPTTTTTVPTTTTTVPTTTTTVPTTTTTVPTTTTTVPTTTTTTVVTTTTTVPTTTTTTVPALTSTVVVYVKDAASGAPLNGATVTLSATGGIRFTAESDTNGLGQVVFSNVPQQGGYKLVGRMQGYVRNATSDVVVDSDPETFNIMMSAR